VKGEGKLTDQDPCEICNTTAETIPPGGDYLHQNCPRCGEFKLSGTAASMLRNRRSSEFIAKLSGWVRDHNRGTDVPMISSNVLKEVDDSKALSVTERSQRLLLEALRGQKKLGDHFNINEPRFIAASHSQDESEVGVLLRVLTEQNLMKATMKEDETEILPRGYTEAEKLEKEVPEPDGTFFSDQTGFDVGATTFDAKDGGETDYLLTEDGDRLLTEDGEPIELESGNELPDTQAKRRTPPLNPIPWAGRPSGSHICTSTIGIGGGLVGVTAVFVPYKGNFGHAPSELADFLGWDDAVLVGEGSAALDNIQIDLREQLLVFGFPGSELDGFLRQLRIEAWITVSGSPINSHTLPDDNTGAIRHPTNKRIWAISTYSGILFYFMGSFFGSPISQFGAGAISELTGIKNFNEEGRELIRDTKDAWRIVSETIGRIPSETPQEDPAETAQEPHVATRPEENDK